MTMKKYLIMLLVVSTMILCLAGCGGKKATAVVTFDDLYDVVLLPASGMKNIGVQVENNHIMTVNVTKEGVYTIPFIANGTTYDFTLTYENGKFTGEADPELTFSIK